MAIGVDGRDVELGPFGPESPRIARLILRAGSLTRAEILALDAAEAIDRERRLTAWNAVRFASDAEPLRTWRFAARNRAWDAAAIAARRVGFDVPDSAAAGYWNTDQRPGWGAARAARFAACALVVGDSIDPLLRPVLVMPWTSVIGHRA